ncbi:MAG TPA: hypothetical protein VGE97_10315 [Nitrososphaera sp.]|jgi:hypothetical protein
MSRGILIFIFWALGFSIGAVGFLIVPSVVSWLGSVLPQIVLNQAMLGAILAGVVGSGISTFTVVTWANKSS